MSVANAFALSLSLSADSFAASLGRDAGAGRARLLRAARTGLVFAAFEVAALTAGWGLGAAASNAFQALDHWIALALLTLIGGRMIREGLRGAPAAAGPESRSRPLRLVATALATSIDACAVGASLALAGGGYVAAALALAAVTFAMTFAGSILGPRLGAVAGRRAEIAGGAILIAVGLNIAISHAAGL